MADSHQVMRAAHHAVETGALRQLGQCAGMALGVLRRLEARGPDVVVREARQDRHGDQLGAAIDRFRRGLHHVQTAGGMQVHDAGGGIDPHQRLHGGGNGVGNVVELQVEEDGKSRLRHAGITCKAMGVEELHADLGPADMWLQRLGQRHGVIEVRRVEGDTDRVGRHGRGSGCSAGLLIQHDGGGKVFNRRAGRLEQGDLVRR